VSSHGDTTSAYVVHGLTGKVTFCHSFPVQAHARCDTLTRLSMAANKVVQTDQSFGVFTKEADTDYLLARMINFLGAGFYGRTGFFAQQACEKYMKALMVERTRTYLETHNLKDLAAQCVPYEPYFADAKTLAILGAVRHVRPSGPIRSSREL
jgi:hypothetical protein